MKSALDTLEQGVKYIQRHQLKNEHNIFVVLYIQVGSYCTPFCKASNAELNLVFVCWENKIFCFLLFFFCSVFEHFYCEHLKHHGLHFICYLFLILIIIFQQNVSMNKPVTRFRDHDVSTRHTRTMCGIYSKSSIKTRAQHLLVLYLQVGTYFTPFCKASNDELDLVFICWENKILCFLLFFLLFCF